MNLRPPLTASDPVSAEAVLKSLCHAVRGRLSRLHLRVELAVLSAEQKGAMLQELNAIDSLLAEHRALVQSQVLRPPERVPLAQLFGQWLNSAGLSEQVLCDASLHTEIWAWPEVLLGAVRPLVLNALQHGQPLVCLSFSRNGEGCQISCTDAGGGFDPARLPELLVPFNHVSAGAHRGAGIGLATAMRFASWMEGTLQAEQLHPGFQVCLQLPNRLLVQDPAA